MDATPTNLSQTNTTSKRRRWFRFKLSTVLILTAIAAWAMALRPDVDYGHRNWPLHPQPSRMMHMTVGIDCELGDPDPIELGNSSNFGVSVAFTRRTEADDFWWTIKPKSLIYPALALVAIGVWKWISRRRKAAAA